MSSIYQFQIQNFILFPFHYLNHQLKLVYLVYFVHLVNYFYIFFVFVERIDLPFTYM